MTNAVSHTDENQFMHANIVKRTVNQVALFTTLPASSIL